MPIVPMLIVESLLAAAFGALSLTLWHSRRAAVATVWLGLLALLVVVPWHWRPSAAEPARRIRVLSVFDAETTDALVEAFTRETGIACDVDPFAGGTQTTVQLILQGRVQPDILLGGTVEIHEELAKAGKLVAYAVPPDPQRVGKYDDPEHMWTPLYLGYLALIYRPLPTFRAHPPDWVTLVDPQWSGRISIPSPSTSGGGLVFLATQILRQKDPALAWDFLGLLVQHGVRFEPRSDLPITRVAAGTMDLGVAWAHDALRRRERERLPLEIRIPDMTGYEVGGVSILGWVRDRQAAEAFVRFLTGKRAGQVQVAHGFRVPLRTDVAPPSYIDQADLQNGTATAFYDRQQVLRHRAEWVQRWESLVSSGS